MQSGPDIVAPMTWHAAAEQVTSRQAGGIRPGRRIAPPPIVMPAPGALAHAVSDDGVTACGEESASGLRLLTGPWPLGNRGLCCSQCLAVTDGNAGN